MMHWYDGAHMGAGGWVAMSLLTVLFWAGVIMAGYVLVRSTQVRRQTGEDALRLLDERLARGEIDADDYARRRDLLGRG